MKKTSSSAVSAVHLGAGADTGFSVDEMIDMATVFEKYLKEHLKNRNSSLTKTQFKILVTEERALLWNEISIKLPGELLCSVSPTRTITRPDKTDRRGSTLTLDLRCVQQISLIIKATKKIVKKSMPGYSLEKACKPTNQTEPKLKMIQLIDSEKKYEKNSCNMDKSVNVTHHSCHEIKSGLQCCFKINCSKTWFRRPP